MTPSTYAYDNADRLTSTTAPGNVVTNYTFDANGNQTGAGAKTFSYDRADRLRTAAIASTTETYTYWGGRSAAIGLDRLTGQQDHPLPVGSQPGPCRSSRSSATATTPYCARTPTVRRGPPPRDFASRRVSTASHKVVRHRRVIAPRGGHPLVIAAHPSVVDSIPQEGLDPLLM